MRTLLQDIQKYEGETWTLPQIMKHASSNTVGYLYTDLIQKNLSDVFSRADACIILLNGRRNIGHFVCLIKAKNGFYFFDSYGHDLSFLLNLEGLPNTLVTKLKQYQTDRNPFPYEKLESRINTCGLHCLIRTKLYKMSEQEYKHYMQLKGLRADMLVTLMNFIWLQ